MDKLFKELSEQASIESHQRGYDQPLLYRKLILGPGVIGEDGIKGEAGSFALEAIRHKYNSAVKALEGPSTWYGGRTKRRVTKRARHSRRYISEPIHATPPNFGIPKSGRRKNSKRIGRR